MHSQCLLRTYRFLLSHQILLHRLWWKRHKLHHLPRFPSQYFLHIITLQPETALAFVSEIYVFSASELRTKRETYPTIVIDFRWSECLLPLLFFWEREKMRPWNAFSKPHVSLWASYFIWIPCLHVLPVLSLVSSLFSLWGWQRVSCPTRLSCSHQGKAGSVMCPWKMPPVFSNLCTVWLLL